MQQRNKRLAIIWAKTFVTMIAGGFIVMMFVAALALLPDFYKAVVLIAMGVGVISFMAYGIAKLKLESEERDQSRILRSLSKGYDE